jgi:uncharacterized membrane protein
VEKILWLVLGSATLVAALRAGSSRRALYVGRGALGALFIGAGALVNTIYLASGADYSDFADAAHIAFVRDAWHSLVAPNQVVFIGLLIVFEATVGALILSGGRRSQVGLLGLIGMHVGLLAFGWVLSVWSIVMLAALVLLLRAERRRATKPATARVAPSRQLSGVGS